MKLVKLKSNLMLFLTALIWGTTFVAQKSASDLIPTFTFNALRSIIGAFSLFLISFFIKSKHDYKNSPLYKSGIVAGIFLFFGMTLQQWGIASSSAGHAGFVSSLYIVLVPLFALVLGKKINKTVWGGVILSLFGVYFLCSNNSSPIGRGDFIILLSAIFFALHIIWISEYTKKVNSIKLSCVQFSFAGAISLFLALIFDDINFQNILKCAFEILFTGVLSCAAAFTLQISAQKFVKPYIASLILSLESVFSVIAGFLLLGEILSPKEITGCVLMFIAVFLAQYHKK